MLPKVTYPLTELEIESVGKIHMRPMLVREEKILLMAKQSENDNDIFTAIKQIVQNCIVTENFNINTLPIHELEYLFVKLRVQSMGSEVKLTYKDSEDNEEYNFTINLDDIHIFYPENMPDRKIDLVNGIGILMQYPPASLYDNERFLSPDSITDISEELMLSSINQIYDEDDVYKPSEYKRDELEEFFESIDSEAFKKMQVFLANVPHMKHVLKYTNKNGTERSIMLRTINDFFTL